MRVGLHLSGPEGLALAAGFKAQGWRVSVRDGEHYTQGQVENFDAVVTDGYRGNRRDLITDYAARGIPAIVIDFGYLKRKDERRDGYYSLGLGWLNWVPPFECPADRFRKLGLKLGKPHGGDVTVIAGQMPGDAAHPFGDAAQIKAWALKVVARIDGPVVYRPHPRAPDVAPDGLEIDRLPLAESLAHAGKVIAYTSNIGHDALMAGVEVEADGPAAWRGVTVADRKPYFHRLAYAQWTLDEIASGEAVQFILRAHHGDLADG